MCCVAASCLCAHTSQSERVEEREGCGIVNQAEDVQSGGVNKNRGCEEV